jgi:hypothetical protein
LLDV